jgi:hypothetical protein
MTRKEFTVFVEQKLDELLRFTEEYTHTSLSRKIKFQWLGDKQLIDEGIVETIVAKVWVDAEHIYPRVDLAVGELAADGSSVVVAHVPRYKPRPFYSSRIEREGPFVILIAQRLLDRLGGRVTPPERVATFVIPSMD